MEGNARPNIKMDGMKTPMENERAGLFNLGGFNPGSPNMTRQKNPSRPSLGQRNGNTDSRRIRLLSFKDVFQSGLMWRNNRPNRSSSSQGAGSGAHYALCALGVGLIALGIVMIVWTVIPMDGEESGGSTTSSSGNSTAGPGNDDTKEEDSDKTKSSSVAMVLVGVGAAMLLLSICLGVRNKRRARNSSNQQTEAASTFLDHVAGEQEEAVDRSTYNVPSYEEAVGSGNFPVRQSNLRHSTSQLPSYEDIIAAVENEGVDPANNPTEETPLNNLAPTPAEPAAELQPDPPALTPNPSLPTRSTSRASRLLRPLRVRRIKSDKLHLRDIRLQIRSPTQNPVTIEPITPPPQYEGKMPELG